MESSVKSKVMAVLMAYLEENRLRKTTERFAVLDTVYDFDGRFTLEELEALLEKKSFHVCRATLYNSLKLFARLRLVVRHRFGSATVYEPCCHTASHSHQICTVCGKVTPVRTPEVDAAVDALRLRRFRKDGYTLYVYGICTTCQTRLSKKKTKNSTRNK